MIAVDRGACDESAYALLAARLCEVMAEFLTRQTSAGQAPDIAQALSSDDNIEADQPTDEQLLDGMTLRQVQIELCLTKAQIVKLRRSWNFPSPRLQDGEFLFSRGDVESWACVQPNPENYAAVLRLRRSGAVRAGEIVNIA